MCPLIQARVERYAASKIRFKLMTVAGSRWEQLARRLKAARRRRDKAVALMMGDDEPAEAGAIHDDGDAGDGAEALPSDEWALQQMVADLENELDR
mgnify:CR=1 FL=1